MDKICSKCGNSFDCKQDTDSCWCSEYPSLKKEQISLDLDCFCESCLKQMYFKKLFPEK